MNLNKVFLYGHLTRSPELKATPGGQSVATFGIATNRVWTNKAGKRQEDTEFHNIVAWGKLAETVSSYLGKGSGVLIEGRLQTRSWEAKDGTKRSTTEIVAEAVQFGPKPGGAGTHDPSDEGLDAIQIEEVPDNEVPF